MNSLITVCARGGSKGIPGKNVKILNGIPLLVYTLKVAKKFAIIYESDIAISTDDEEIRTIANQFGFITEYYRPPELATDSAGKIDTICDLLNYQEAKNSKRYDYILDLDVTSPLRTINDLQVAFDSLIRNPIALNIFSVNKSTRNPYFNMVELKENGYFNIVKKGNNFLTRQTAPEVYDLNASFYIYRRSFFAKKYKTVFTESSLIYLMPHICFDLDHIHDFEYLDFLLKNKKLSFKI
jgi:CMP-N,N'-diacetyllegionaminic acid synthase